MKLTRTAGTLLIVGTLAGTIAPAQAHASGLPTWKAKQVARSRAWDLSSRVERVHIDWYNRWSRYVVHLGVTGSWTREIYHSGCEDGYYPGCSSDSWTEKRDSECDATVAVRKSRSTGRVSSRVRDKSCFYG